MKITDELRTIHNLYVSTGVYKTEPTTVWGRAADEIDRLTAQLATREEACRHGQHLIDTAEAWGRANNDGEGPFNFVTRKCYEQGREDATAKLAAQLAEREEREAMVLTQLGYHAEYVKGEKLNRMHINRAATVLKQHCENILKHGTTSPRFHAAEGEG